MRTKTLLLTAALSFAAIATSMAQVYSVNAVGYVNKVLPSGFSLIANQLTRTPDMKLDTLLPGVPTESLVQKYNSATGLYSTDIFDGTSWLDNDSGAASTTTLSPGEGFFFYNASNPAADITVTFVGEVPQGDVGMTLPALRFSLIASKVPQVITLSPTVGFPHVPEALFMSFVNGNYVTLINDGTEWLNNDTGTPTPATAQVGEGFFLYNSGGPTGTDPLNWVRTFSVN
jgi:hypothetical protein